MSRWWHKRINEILFDRELRLRYCWIALFVILALHVTGILEHGIMFIKLLFTLAIFIPLMVLVCPLTWAALILGWMLRRQPYE